jgi:hypothetical protein
MSASKLSEQWVSGAVEREMCEYIAGTFDPRFVLKLMEYIIALRNEMALRVFEDTRERAAKAICSDCASGNKPYQKHGQLIHAGTETGSWSGERKGFMRPCKAEAIRAMQPDGK